MVAMHTPLLKSTVNRLCTGIYLGDLVVFILTVPVQFWLGHIFYHHAWKAVKHRSARMEVLVVFGTTSSFVHPVLAMCFATMNTNPHFHPAVFFDTSTGLVSFVSFGRYLENLAKGKTSTALTDLMALAPNMATIYTDAACIIGKKIATELVQVGDTIKIELGNKIPKRYLRRIRIGRIGRTGSGDSVIGGTVNGLGTFHVLVTRAGTCVDRQARGGCTNFEGPNLGVCGQGRGILYPNCAFPRARHFSQSARHLACPLFRVAAQAVQCPGRVEIGRASNLVVVCLKLRIQSGHVLEASKDITIMAPGKTSTMTEANSHWSRRAGPGTTSHSTPPLEGLAAGGQTSKCGVLSLVAVAEAKSEHPLARAIACYGKSTLGPHIEPAVESFESGVKAHMTLASQVGQAVYVGSAAFASGRTVVFASIGNPPVLAVYLSDVPKLSSAPAIRALHEIGIKVCLMTGDSASITHAIAQEAGVPSNCVWPDVSSKGKASKVSEMGKGVAIIGDGINYCPEPVAAPVGIALSSGTSIAVETADIVLMRSSLLVAALHLSHSIFAMIRRNLVLACVYNVLGIPLEMGVGLPWGVGLHPMLADAAMAFSSMSVVRSSLLLRFWARPVVEGVDEEEKVGGVLRGVWKR